MRELVEAARAAVAPGAPEPQVGAMIEVPAAAAQRARDRAPLRLPLDRDERPGAVHAGRRPRGSARRDRALAYHPAVVRLVSRVVTAAHAAGIPVDVCGEAAGDPEFLPLLVGLGVDEISVSPARLAQTRRLIRSLSSQAAREALAAALHAGTADEVASRRARRALR